ncbi:MAG: sugar kinase [Candidatus Gastranaerophilales bacterium]|nr:sugar kinase [Candidatus Gastranaerophilales bacterium]
MNNQTDIITIGESLIELSTSEDLTTAQILNKYYGGDTITSAIAALKLGSKVGFISRIGMDCFKNYLLESWQDVGLDISQVKPVKGINGLYIVSNNEDCNTRDFSFYRKKTAATNLSIDDISIEYIKNTSLVYSTGITQSLSISAREAVKKAFQIAKENNVTVAYDPNYTSKLWSEDEAREAFDEIIDFTDILFLNTKYDSNIVIETKSIDNTISYLQDKGISTVIIKSSVDKGVYAGYQGNIEFIKFPEINIVDVTGGSDTFNGAVMHGIVSGMSPYKAVNLGCCAAGIQMQSWGAVKSIPNRDEVYKIFKGSDE